MMDEWLYRALLRAYPRGFRGKFESRMLELFAYRREQARVRGGALWRLRFWGFVTADLTRSAWAERYGRGSSGVPDSF